MANLFSLFKDLIPSNPLVIGTIQVSEGDTHQVELVGGGVLVARGKALPGQRVFISGDVIQGVAPNLPTELIEV